MQLRHSTVKILTFQLIKPNSMKATTSNFKNIDQWFINIWKCQIDCIWITTVEGAEVWLRRRWTRQLLRPWCHVSPHITRTAQIFSDSQDEHYTPVLCYLCWYSPIYFRAPSLQVGCTIPAAGTTEIRSLTMRLFNFWLWNKIFIYMCPPPSSIACWPTRLLVFPEHTNL